MFGSGIPGSPPGPVRSGHSKSPKVLKYEIACMTLYSHTARAPTYDSTLDFSSPERVTTLITLRGECVTTLVGLLAPFNRAACEILHGVDRVRKPTTSPRVSRNTSSTSRYSGSAPASGGRPWYARGLQHRQHKAMVVDQVERFRMPRAEGLARHLQRLAEQRLSSGDVALVLQQQPEVVDEDERVRVPTAEGLARHLQRLAAQRLSGGEVALVLQQLAEVVDEGERGRMPIAERLARHLQRLA
eukprot:scaffold116146_cov61-Phaeocystis_antarctica.AAC.3